MPDFVNVTYDRTGESARENALGMRPMQAKAYAQRDAQYLLVKAPPASGKSRALMFIGLDKLAHQGLEKVIVAVPERSIGASFSPADLTAHGFFADWAPEDEWNLCRPGGETGKVAKLGAFLESDADILICTHSTLRFAFEKLGAAAFGRCCLAVDEFHHVSADAENRLGEVVRALIAAGEAHIVAMTGSYFRGDRTPVLRPEDEEKFTRVTYTYYEQLNGYAHLKTLGIGYHFYRGRYLDAIKEVLDPARKTIIHIPHVRSAESTQAKYEEVDHILDVLGTWQGQDDENGIHHVAQADGRVLKVADLVEDDPQSRDRLITYLRSAGDRDAVDVIIALGMAKEGFDWPWCEHALTVGYRGSLTEIVQIIGRATRDAPGKSHAQFTNLIAEPDAASDKVAESVNNMLKAVACSLLMEQVLAPNFKFKTRPPDDQWDGGRPVVDIDFDGGESTVKVKGLAEPSTPLVRQIVEDDLLDLTASVMQDPKLLKTAMNEDEMPPEMVNQVLIPRIIQDKYPTLSEQEVDEVRQHLVSNAAFKTGCEGGAPEVSDKFVKLAGRFINIDDLSIDLIDSINPFQQAYEVLSKSMDSDALQRIHGAVKAQNIQMSEDEARMLWPRIQRFFETHGREPALTAVDPMEKRMAEALHWLRVRQASRAQTAQEA